MNLGDYVEYQRREYCKDLPCQIQMLLAAETEGSASYERVRSICKSSCIHTTNEFHHWLIQKGYLVIRPTSAK